MKLLFDRIYELPDPVPFADAIAITPSRVKILSVRPPTDSRFRYEHPIRKLVFFALREGPLNAFRKSRNAAFYKRVELTRALTLSVGHVRDTAIQVVALGPQDCPYSDCHLYPKALVKAVDGDAIDDMSLQIERLLADRQDIAYELLEYSPYSGVSLIYRIEDFLTRRRYSPASAQDGKIENLVIAFSPKKERAPPARLKGRDRADGDLFLVGAGSYATSYVLPNLKSLRRHTVIDINPIVAGRVGERFGFSHIDTSLARGLERLRGSTKPVLVVATYHSTHVHAVECALANEPSTYVMVEKPPVTTSDQLNRLVALARSGAMLEMGFNRRHAKMTRMCKEILGSQAGATVVHCIVKELSLPENHWYYWPSQRTRIIGNLVHWIDLGVHLIEANPACLILAQDNCGRAGDEVSITVLFKDGSRLVVSATDRGNSIRGVQEYIDVRRGDVTIKIDDFVSMNVLQAGKSRTHRALIRSKGHSAMYKAFSRAVATHSQPVYPLKDLIVSSVLALSAAELAERRQAVRDFCADDFDL